MSDEFLITTTGQSVPASQLATVVPLGANISCASVTTSGDISSGGDLNAVADVNAVNAILSGAVNALSVSTSGSIIAGSDLSAENWLAILTAGPVPSAPVDGFILYCDSNDNKLYAIGSSGTITPLALP